MEHSRGIICPELRYANIAEMDQSRGLQDPRDVARRMRGDKKADMPVVEPVKASANGALDDNSIANNLRQQAAKMTAEAKGLMAEADRLLKEAASMDPAPAEKPKRKCSGTKVYVVQKVATYSESALELGAASMSGRVKATIVG